MGTKYWVVSLSPYPLIGDDTENLTSIAPVAFGISFSISGSTRVAALGKKTKAHYNFAVGFKRDQCVSVAHGR